MCVCSCAERVNFFGFGLVCRRAGCLTAIDYLKGAVHGWALAPCFSPSRFSRSPPGLKQRQRLKFMRSFSCGQRWFCKYSTPSGALGRIIIEEIVLCFFFLGGGASKAQLRRQIVYVAAPRAGSIMASFFCLCCRKDSSKGLSNDCVPCSLCGLRLQNFDSARLFSRLIATASMWTAAPR